MNFVVLWQDAEGNQFLKLSATNYAINLLICGKDCKKSGLSNGEKLNELKSMRNTALEGGDSNVDAWEEGSAERPTKFRRDMERTVSIEGPWRSYVLTNEPKWPI